MYCLRIIKKTGKTCGSPNIDPNYVHMCVPVGVLPEARCKPCLALDARDYDEVQRAEFVAKKNYKNDRERASMKADNKRMLQEFDLEDITAMAEQKKKADKLALEQERRRRAEEASIRLGCPSELAYKPFEYKSPLDNNDIPAKVLDIIRAWVSGDGAGRQMFRQTVMVGMPMPSVLSMMFWRLFTDNQIDVYDANSIIEVAKEVVTAHRTASLARMQANGPYNGLNYGTLPSLSPSSTMASFATNVSIPPPTTTELEGIMHAIANNN